MQKSIRQRMRKKEAVQPGTTALPQVAGASSRRITADRGACILVLAFAIVLPNLTGESILQLGKLDYLLAGVMLAVGLNIVLGFAGQLFLGPAAIFGLAAYAAAYAANQVTALQSFPAMVVISLGVSIVASLFVAIPALRIGHFYLGMITLVLASLVPTVASQLNLVGGQSGLSLIANPSFVQSPTGYALYLLGLLIVIVLLGCSWLIKSSQLGREFEAMRQSEHLATSIGIHTYRTKVLVFAIASPAAALAAAYYVYSQQFVSPGSVTVNLSIYLLAGVVIGGAGKIVGPAIGVALVLAASEFLGSFSQYEGIVFGALLVSVAVAQAYGLSLASLLRPYLANAVRLLKPSGGDQTPAVEAFEPRSPVKVLIPSATNGTPTPATASATPGELEAPAAMTPGFGVFPASPRPESTGAKLELRAIRRAFGGNQAVKDVSLTVEQGTVHALVGPNGSGKTTVLNLISKLYRVDGGEVWLNGVRIDNIGAADLARCGLSRTFQTPKLVDQATISTNVLLAAEIAGGGSGVRSMLRLPGSRRLLREAHLGAAEAIRTVKLDGIQRVAGSVPHGTQRLIEVARAVASKPRFLLLDEPAAGLSPAEVATLKGTVRSFADAGMGVLLVEHNMRLVLDLADEITVLDEGEVVARGDPQQVIRDPIVAKVYLGERAESKSRNAGRGNFGLARNVWSPCREVWVSKRAGRFGWRGSMLATERSGWWKASRCTPNAVRSSACSGATALARPR
jgi:branched-chain amino acid transport system permease protein